MKQKSRWNEAHARPLLQLGRRLALPVKFGSQFAAVLKAIFQPPPRAVIELPVATLAIVSRCTMTQAIVDPGELRRFAQMLRRFNEELNEKTAAVAGQLSHLGQTWRDQEHLRFSEEFVSNMKALSRFTESNEQFIPYLLRKAQLVEEYLQQQ